MCGIFFARLARKESIISNSRVVNSILIASIVILSSRFFYLPLLEATNSKELDESSDWNTLVAQMAAADVWLVGLGVSAFCAFLVLRPHSAAARVLTVTPVRMLAPLSYCLYLMHVPVLQSWSMISHRLHIPLASWGSLIMAWSLTLLSAYVLHYSVEVPFHRIGRRG